MNKIKQKKERDIKCQKLGYFMMEKPPLLVYYTCGFVFLFLFYIKKD